MNGDCANTRVIGKSIFDTVTVMSIKVQIKHPRHAHIQKPINRQDRIIEITEPTGLCGLAMVRAGAPLGQPIVK